MDAAFAATAGGLTALAIFLSRSAGRPRLVPAALAVAAVALVLSAVYRLDAGDDGDDVIHRWASGTAGAAVVVAAVGWSVVGIRRQRPWRSGSDMPIALLALGLAVVSPMLHETFLTGINQRLVWAALIAWSLVVTISELAARHGSRRLDRGSRRSARQRRPR